MRGKLIGRFVFRKKNEARRLKILQSDLKRLENEHKNTADHKIIAGIKMKRWQFNEILSQEIQKKMIYTKQRYYEAGSRAAKITAIQV